MKVNRGLVFVVSVLFLLSLTGCLSNNINEMEDEKYSLVSTENKLVFKKDNNYEVFYLNEGVYKIEKVKAFANETYANQYYAENDSLEYKSVLCVDNLVIFEMPSEYLNSYSGMLRTDIMFSMVESGYEFIDVN